MSLVNCTNCGTLFENKSKWGIKKFCSRPCANRRFHCDVTKRKTQESLRRHFAKNPRLKQGKKPKVCSVCEELHFRSGITCSDTCANYLVSVKRQQKIMNSSWTQPKKMFTYKHVTVRCDSMLEESAIIYLVDLNPTIKIERFRSLINYWIGKSHKTFNPDFWAIIDGRPTIIEVKMKWTSKNKTNHYIMTIPYKKEALQNFCKAKNYALLWIDTTNQEFLRVYKTHLKENRLVRST